MCINSIKFFVMIFFSMTLGCKKRDYHRDFEFYNNSLNPVLFTLKATNVIEGCNLHLLHVVQKGKSVKIGDRKSYWEDRLSNGEEYIFFIVNPNDFNDQEDFYPCDSIEYNNTILKKYSVTLEELESNDFKVYYP
jgi:hypothetical protein